jgi:hypothetical protein
MKIFAILALIGLPMMVFAQQRPAYVADFNGYYLAISLSTLDKVTDFEPADVKASEICETVGKIAELQNREKVTEHRFMLFYVCL